MERFMPQLREDHDHDHQQLRPGDKVQRGEGHVDFVPCNTEYDSSMYLNNINTCNNSM